MYGKHHTKKSIEKMSRIKKGKYLKVNPETIRYRIKTKKPGYYYINYKEKLLCVWKNL